MTTGPEFSDIALAWVAALTSRGVTVQVRGKNLAYHPKSGYSEMSNDERATLKQHKAAIVAVIKERYAGTAGLPVQVETRPTSASVEPTTVPAPEPCKWCYRSPCIGPEHPAFSVLHALDPEEVQRRNAEATAEMMMQIGRPPRWDC